MKVILVHPEIPQNTGNIIRTCDITGSSLTLVRPLGFNLSSKQMKRAGLDYGDELDLQIVDSFKPKGQCYFFSSKATRPYTDIEFSENVQLVFGSESAGLPANYHEEYAENFYTIPMKKERRSLNLSNCVAIVLYEALRQMDFRGLR